MTKLLLWTDIKISALLELAKAILSSIELVTSLVLVIITLYPEFSSLSLSLNAISRSTLFSVNPEGPIAPKSDPPCPGSIHINITELSAGYIFPILVKRKMQQNIIKNINILKMFLFILKITIFFHLFFYNIFISFYGAFNIKCSVKIQFFKIYFKKDTVYIWNFCYCVCNAVYNQIIYNTVSAFICNEFF